MEQIMYVVVNRNGEYMDRYQYSPPGFTKNFGSADLLTLEDAMMYADYAMEYGVECRVMRVEIILTPCSSLEGKNNE